MTSNSFISKDCRRLPCPAMLLTMPFNNVLGNNVLGLSVSFTELVGTRLAPRQIYFRVGKAVELKAPPQLEPYCRDFTTCQPSQSTHVY